MALFRSYSFFNFIRNQGQCLVLRKAVYKNVNLYPVLIDSRRSLFWEKDRKGGYQTAENISNFKHMKLGFKELKKELKLFGKEMKDLWESDQILIARPGETDVLWCLDRPEVLENFVTTSDSDHNEGHSHCKLEMGEAGRARFHGYLDTRVPKDGKIKKAGYCAIRSKQLRKSFKRATTYDWHLYNTLVLKVRGDGRSYLLNISCEGYYDITWNDIYHYVLYTRGGPYWQIAKIDMITNNQDSTVPKYWKAQNSNHGKYPVVHDFGVNNHDGFKSFIAKIPFSKFVLGSKGRLQDKQNRMRFDKVTHFGISCGDKINGRFDLEIEYIGLEFDPTHEEEFAYEMYKTERYIVGV